MPRCIPNAIDVGNRSAAELHDETPIAQRRHRLTGVSALLGMAFLIVNLGGARDTSRLEGSSIRRLLSDGRL
jgi:hypothetical protein